MSVSKILTLEEISAVRRHAREAGRTVVFTNGCFDLLHVGHVRYLREARAMGDCLIVAVNSDRSVRAIKGKHRPVTPELERAEVLAALAAVDHVVIFDDLTPQRLVDLLIPDVLVKGADWGPGEIVGRETVERAGGVVRTIPLVEGASTSAIIERILACFTDTSEGSGPGASGAG